MSSPTERLALRRAGLGTDGDAATVHGLHSGNANPAESSCPVDDPYLTEDIVGHDFFVVPMHSWTTACWSTARGLVGILPGFSLVPLGV